MEKEKRVSKKAKRRFGVLLFCLFGLAGYMIVSMANYWTKIIENHNETRELTAKYEELLKEEKSLKSEVAKLEDPDYVARYASEKFLYSKDGMTIIRVIEKEKN